MSLGLRVLLLISLAIVVPSFVCPQESDPPIFTWDGKFVGRLQADHIDESQIHDWRILFYPHGVTPGGKGEWGEQSCGSLEKCRLAIIAISKMLEECRKWWPENPSVCEPADRPWDNYIIVGYLGYAPPEQKATLANALDFFEKADSFLSIIDDNAETIDPSGLLKTLIQPTATYVKTMKDSLKRAYLAEEILTTMTSHANYEIKAAFDDLSTDEDTIVATTTKLSAIIHATPLSLPSASWTDSSGFNMSGDFHIVVSADGPFVRVDTTLTSNYSGTQKYSQEFFPQSVSKIQVEADLGRTDWRVDLTYGADRGTLLRFANLSDAINAAKFFSSISGTAVECDEAVGEAAGC